MEWEFMGGVIERQFTIFCDRATLESREVQEFIRRADSVVVVRDDETGLMKVKGIISDYFESYEELVELDDELDEMIRAVRRVGADIFVL